MSGAENLNESEPNPAKRSKFNDGNSVKNGAGTPDFKEIFEKDLPLLANIRQVSVEHYLFQFDFDFNRKCVGGVAILFLNVLSPSLKSIILDCCSLKVTRVDLLSTKVECTPKRGQERNDFYKSGPWFDFEGSQELNFNTSKWAITIQGWESEEPPSVIRIKYETLPNSASIQWRPTMGHFGHRLWTDPTMRRAVYTPGVPINNRGLFPCQEHPTAMATWEAFILLPTRSNWNQNALLTSDEVGLEIPGEDRRKIYFYTNHRLPMSNFALVIGDFYIDKYPLCPQVQFHTFLPIGQEILEEMKVWVPQILKSAQKLLGSNPFPRLDLVVMPLCSSDLGMSSPHLIFISKSNFKGTSLGKQYLYSRIAHELSHMWFGLSLGALDWREEFLSEGFATFVEDFIYKEAAKALNPDMEDSINRELELTSLLRLMELQNELENTEEQFQSLSKGNIGDSSAIKNGLVPDKKFMNVHYLKGFFLLRHLSSIVGVDEFLSFLKHYATKFQGQLLTSEMFLEEFFTFPSFDGKFTQSQTTVESIKRDWLLSTQLIPPLNEKIHLGIDGKDSLLKVYPQCESFLRKIHRIFDSNTQLEMIPISLSPNETILLLNRILEGPLEPSEVTKKLLLYLEKELILGKDPNPDISVLHRWCELVLKYMKIFTFQLVGKDLKIERAKRLEFVKDFLLENASMGIYIYGELMISEKKSYQKVARDLYNMQRDTLDPQAEAVLKEMIF